MGLAPLVDFSLGCHYWLSDDFQELQALKRDQLRAFLLLMLSKF